MSDGPQGPGWWVASDGKWYPPQPLPEQPTVPQPPTGPPSAVPPAGGYDPTATTAVSPPGTTGPTYGQPGAPTFPPPGPGGGPSSPPAWGPGASGPASTGSGSGSGGKIALLIGVIVLVLLLIGGAVFALTRPKDVVVEGPATTSSATATSPGTPPTSAESSTTKKSTTTTGESTTTTRKTTTTTSKSSTTTIGIDQSTARQNFDSVTADWLPGTTATEREALAHDICSAIDDEGITSFLQELSSMVPPGTSATNSYKFVGASLAAFCPEHLQDIQDLTN